MSWSINISLLNIVQKNMSSGEQPHDFYSSLFVSPIMSLNQDDHEELFDNHRWCVSDQLASGSP